MIDFYNIKYYNQGDTYSSLFTDSNNYSVQSLIDKGIPAEKIVIGK